MKKVLFILLFIISVTAVFAGTGFAQDIDIENMDNEQLLILLQSIVQKLEQEETEAEPTAEPESGGSVIVIVGDPADNTGSDDAEEDLPKFQIYENKKLIISRMPDSYFVPADNGDGDGTDDGDTGDPPVKTPVPGQLFPRR